ncbi:MAG: hypothetical protein ACR2OB_11580 [Solirubrobacteraceae bacterium]
MEASTFSRRRMPPARGARAPRGAPAHPTFIRWLWIWITVGFLVVVVVIGFLLGIVSALKSIDSGLAEANSAVTGIGAEAHPLPGYIQEINSNLTSIDGALKPITGQADQIVSGLTSIRGKLVQINGSLINTSGSLVNTSGSLVNTTGTLGQISNSLVDTSGTLGQISSSLVGTSGTLQGVAGSLIDTSGRLVTISGSLTDIAGRLKTVRSRAGTINNVLNRAEAVNISSGPPSADGTQAIWRRVRFANGGSFSRPGFDNNLAGPNANPNGLQPVNTDAQVIIGGLIQVNGHLLSICEAPVLNNTLLGGLGLVKPGPC